MKRASITELHTHTSKLVREAAVGAVIVIEKRGEPVAELHPFPEHLRQLRLPGIARTRKGKPEPAADVGLLTEGA